VSTLLFVVHRETSLAELPEVKNTPNVPNNKTSPCRGVVIMFELSGCMVAFVVKCQLAMTASPRSAQRFASGCDDKIG